MGIGRFAFTPLLPLMQQSSGLSLQQAAWLASSNYAGYLVGALALAVRPTRAGACVKSGLVVVALATLAMAVSHAFGAWLALRFLAGVASALVLVGVSAWALPALARSAAPSHAGVVFAGVGGGMAIAGLAALAVAALHAEVDVAWLALGALASLACLVAWRIDDSDAPVHGRAGDDAPLPRREATLMVLCYGAFGFGYIIPATFVPSLARAALGDATSFAWAWPLFGVAATLSTLAAARLRHVPAVRQWWVSQIVMAAGVAAPAISTSAAATFFSALCVGGTFMVVTMAGIRHAREVSGPAAPRIVAAMTAAFAVGQWVGPLTLLAAASCAAAARCASVIFAASSGGMRSTSDTASFPGW
jgi:predicted MFS family arabinose efflux permease